MLHRLFILKPSEALAFLHTQDRELWPRGHHVPCPSSHYLCVCISCFSVRPGGSLMLPSPDISAPLPRLACRCPLHLECSLDIFSRSVHLLKSYLSFKVIWIFLLHEIFIKMEVTSPPLERPEQFSSLLQGFSYGHCLLLFMVLSSTPWIHEFFKGRGCVPPIISIFQRLTHSRWSLNSDGIGFSFALGSLILK